MIWPFNKKSKSPEPSNPSPPTTATTLSPPTPGQQTLITKKEWRSFLFTENLILEFVDPPHSAPFRDDFLYLSHMLKDNPHPAVLKLVDFGVKEDKLYRAWEHRHFHSILYSSRRPFRPNFSELLDAFGHLSSLGFSVWQLYLPQFLSADENGIFIARLPLTLKSSLVIYEWSIYEPPREAISKLVFLEPEHFTADGPDRSKADQYIMGALFWCLHASAYPYSTHSALAVSRKLPIERVHHTFPEPLHQVLYRLTELDPEDRYPTYEEGFQELKKALNSLSNQSELNS